jgi:hypothetical protein
MAKPIETVFRDFSTDGNPSTAHHEPIKADIRDLHNAHLVALTGATSGAIVKTSLSDLNATLAHDADVMAWVVGDSTQGNDGVYQKQGASGAGSWTRLKDLPYSVIQINNADAGTANAIQATTAVNVPDAAYGALLVLNITAANTGAVTLSINGETAKPIVTNTGSTLPSGYLVTGMAVICVDDGVSYRLMSYGDASTIQAAAEATLAEMEQVISDFGDLETAITDVNEDRVQTEAAKDDAETAQTAAETAQTAAETAQTAAETARDSAFTNADVYADEPTGRAAVSDGDQFIVIVSDEAIRYERVDAATSNEVARFPSSSYVVAARPVVLPILSDAIYLDDDGAGSLVNADVVDLTDTDLNTMGFTKANRLDNLAAAEDTYGVVNIPSDQLKWGEGDYVAASVIIKTDDWANLDTSRLRVLLFETGGGNYIPTPNMVDYEEISSTVRRYFGVWKMTATISDLEKVWIEVTGVAGRSGAVYATGFMVGLSKSFIQDVAWRDVPRAYNLDQAAFSKGGVVKSVILNGNFRSGNTESKFGGGIVEAIVDADLNRLGMDYAVTLSNLAAVEDTYGRWDATDLVFATGDWAVVSVYIKATDFADLDENRVSLLLYPDSSGSGGVQKFITDYEEIRSDLRRYHGRFEITGLDNGIHFALVEVATSGPKTAPVYVTGYTLGFSHFRPHAVDHTDFETGAIVTRVNDVENVIGISQENPQLLVPSSLHLIEGQLLQLFASGMTERRDSNGFTLSFTGSTKGFEFVEHDVKLDGNDFSGAGSLWARKQNDIGNIFRCPVNFYTSEATKTGSPNILVIGDSLTQQGTVAPLKTKLEAAGLTPNFIGTLSDDGGALCEGRPSWEFSDFTYKYTDVQGDGSAPTYPIDATAAGDGVVTTEAQYLALGDSANFGPRWKYNPFIRPSTGSDDPAFVFNGYIFDLDFYLTRFSFPDPDIVMIALGTNDWSSHSDAVGLANIIEGLNILYTQIRAALPNAKVGIIVNGSSTMSYWTDKIVPFIQHVIDVYGDREAENIFILPAYMYMDTQFIYDMTVSSTDTYGVETGVPGDWVHFGDVGQDQWSDMTFSFVMTQS